MNNPVFLEKTKQNKTNKEKKKGFFETLYGRNQW